MNRWTRWILIGALVAAPTLGYAITKYRAHAAARPGCHCPHK